MKRAAPPPPVVDEALAVPEARCYRHCDRPIRWYRVKGSLAGRWVVGACPDGVVSVTRYVEWSTRDPARLVRATLRRMTRPPSLVTARDLRGATRHGPELGRTAERWLERAGSSRQIRVVYWRVYPSRAADGSERRLFVCLRRRHPVPRFFRADPALPGNRCPDCARRARS